MTIEKLLLTKLGKNRRRIDIGQRRHRRARSV